MKTNGIPDVRALLLGLIVALGLTASVRSTEIDSFEDGQRAGWRDFSFQPPFGHPTESGGRLRFEQPPAGRAIFSASQHVSQELELKNDRTIEMRVDLMEGGGKDSFAILAFIPTANSAGTLAGYGLAKSTTDILITKGIGKYFYNENPATAIKQENVTLSLQLRARNGAVEIKARVLDKSANDAVLFEKVVVDSAAADVLSDGVDDPAAPFLTKGYFTLYLYQDFDRNAPEAPYRAVFDNAEVFVTDDRVIDDFADNTKTDWKDFSFAPPFGHPVEKDGKFSFEQPAAGRAIFSASQKISREYELSEGSRHEFRVDLEQGGAKDSFAILAFIPTANSPGTLAGYGLAKSTTDILITKGIGKYFYNENPAQPILQEKITLSLELTVRNGAVEIAARVYDRDNGNRLIFEKITRDTAAADVLSDGTDDPAAPFLTKGYFTLYLYQDFDRNAPENPYRAVFDNATVHAPPQAANTPPVISGVVPAAFANFYLASDGLKFRVADDKPIADETISVTLNGVKIGKANGLAITADGNGKQVQFNQLKENENYEAILRVEDSEGLVAQAALHFDTFLSGNFAIEVEDYNFGGGQFINQPEPTFEGNAVANAYSLQVGVDEVDYSDTRDVPRLQDAPWRPEDPVRMQRSLDVERSKFTLRGGSKGGVFDYDVGDIAAGEWMNYTRQFPAGTYEVYLRQALVNMPSGESILERVTSDPSAPNQTVEILGSFLGSRTGFQYRNFALTDGAGLKKVRVQLAGNATLRLRQITPDSGDGGRYQNYLLFVRVADDQPQRAFVSSLSPAPDTTIPTVAPTIEAVIQNRSTEVNLATVQLSVQGKTVTPTVDKTPTGARVTYAIQPLPPSGSPVPATLRFKDNDGIEARVDWQFTVVYPSLSAANRRPGTGKDRGMKVRVVQAPAGSGLENTLDRAETQLRPNSSIPKVTDVTQTLQVMNMNKREGAAGVIGDDQLVPGLDIETNGDQDFVVEAQLYLELPAGVHRFGVITDDGYLMTAGTAPDDVKSTPLAFHNGGPANETVDFVVPVAGLYPFRFLWYERGGAAHGEWTSIDVATGERLLINDPDNPKSIKAFVAVDAPPIRLEAADNVGGPYQSVASAAFEGAPAGGAPDLGRFIVPTPSKTQFFRLPPGGADVIRRAQVRAGNLELIVGPASK